jgi:hypothetical protein
MKKVLASVLCLFLLVGFSVVVGCQKAEEQKVSQAPAAPQEENEVEEGKPAGTGEVTITGTLNDQGNIVADEGKEYVVASEDMRKELMGKVDKKVKATGTVEEREGKMVIEVTSYEVIEE